MKKKCYTFRCPQYPKCENAAGSCCAVEWDDSEAILSEKECFAKGNYPLFEPKE